MLLSKTEQISNLNERFILELWKNCYRMVETYQKNNFFGVMTSGQVSVSNPKYITNYRLWKKDSCDRIIKGLWTCISSKLLVQDVQNHLHFERNKIEQLWKIHEQLRSNLVHFEIQLGELIDWTDHNMV